MMVEAKGVAYRYGSTEALAGVDLEVPEGALYALLGPNGAGKTTLLQLLAGLRRPEAGRIAVLGGDPWRHSSAVRSRVGYVAEGQRLPEWMTVGQLERFLAPLYPDWDATLAADLRRRFALGPGRRIDTLSRGEYMKVAVLCALAPRPRLVLMDEPFTGMDAIVKDDVVRALVGPRPGPGWTVVVSSHDIGELEALADRVAVLVDGRVVLSEPMERLRERYRWVEVIGRNGTVEVPEALTRSAVRTERSGARARLLMRDAPDEATLRHQIPAAKRVTVRVAPLRDIFLGVTRSSRAGPREEGS